MLQYTDYMCTSLYDVYNYFKVGVAEAEFHSIFVHIMHGFSDCCIDFLLFVC